MLDAVLPKQKMRPPVVHKQFSVGTTSLDRVAYVGRRIFNMPLGLHSSRTISLAGLGQRIALYLPPFCFSFVSVPHSPSEIIYSNILIDISVYVIRRITDI